MTFLRNIGADLVEKRLWPVAVALLVALVAVPTLLAKSSSDDADVAPPAPVAGAAAVKADQVLALNTKPAGRRKRGGKVKNPFVQLYVPKPAPAAVTPVGTVGGDESKGDSGSTGSGTTPVVSTPPAQDKAAPKANLDVHRVTLRFGEPGAMRTIKDIPRLTPLPSTENPFFVFVGIKDDQDTLVFLVSSDAKATGDGVCRPKQTCEFIELKAGDTEFFDLVTDEGLKQYQMDVVSISTKKASSAAVARKARARHSKAGAALLKAARKSSRATTRIGRYRWDAGDGVLRLIPREQLKAKVAVTAIAGTSSVP